MELLTSIEQYTSMTLPTPELTSKSNMALIPGSDFEMGAKGWGEFESPVHPVFVKDFLLDAAQVTNRQFRLFAEATAYVSTAEQKGWAWGYRDGKPAEILGLCWKTYATHDRDEHPVILVSWHDAAAYAKWAGKRLPTEAEFEKAARGGLSGKLYPWGDEQPTDRLCNFGKEAFDVPPTTPVGHFPPNGYGLFDMCGNVWNWCSDWFSENYYTNSPAENPSGAASGATKVRRGASFNIMQTFRLRCSNRGAYLPDNYAINIGFRCAKDLI